MVYQINFRIHYYHYIMQKISYLRNICYIPKIVDKPPICKLVIFEEYLLYS